jgi:hypothetical protein
MLNGLSLKNFKNFRGMHDIELKPLTLIFGANSSGKSSLIQSLLILKQTVELANDPNLVLLSKGNYVDLGGYKEFINRHDESNNFSIRLFLDPLLAASFQILERLDSDKLRYSTVGIEIVFASDAKLYVNEIKLYVNEKSESFCSLIPYKLQKEVKEHKVMFPSIQDELSDETNYYKVGNFNDNHPFWYDLWERFKREKDLEQVTEKLREKIISLEQELSKVGETFKETCNLIQDKIRESDQFDNLKENLEEVQKVFYEKEVSEINKTMAIFKERYDYVKNYDFNKFIVEIKKFNQNHIYNLKNFLPRPAFIEEGGADLYNQNPNKPYDFNMEFAQDYDINLSLFFIRISREIEIYLKKLIYLGPLRDYPERYYIFSGNIPEYVGKSGRMVPDILFENQKLLNEINILLEEVKLGYQVDIRKFNDEQSGARDVFALKLIDTKTGVDVSIPDVGFGISQVLPIIVQSMLSKDKTILIEQPEIHLHPKLQAEMGSMFAKCIKASRNNKFIIETHSENLILRLQKMIRKKELDHEDVAVIYVDKDPNGSCCFKLRLDEDGDFLDEWPDGFFEESYNEIFG